MVSLKACIDLGTQTCLLLVVKSTGEILVDRSSMVRLGEGVKKLRVLNPQAQERTRVCLREYASVVASYGILSQDVVCVATSQARLASDASLFFQSLKQDFGFVFQILSAEEEGRFAFEGALLPGFPPEEVVVVDIGGGSTELISEHEVQSWDLGCVGLSEAYFPKYPIDIIAWMAAQKTVQERFFSSRKKASLMGVGGTITTLACLASSLKSFDAQVIHGSVLLRQDVEHFLERFRLSSWEEMVAFLGSQKHRADTLLAGTLILSSVMEQGGYSELHVSVRGLRYGALKVCH
jgi:exopolyphosphatase/guanosine-5'-triphosphate,3'-diphosphate pyrophosphatase